MSDNGTMTGAIVQIVSAQEWSAVIVERDGQRINTVVKPLAVWALLDDGRLVGLLAGAFITPAEDLLGFVAYLGPGESQHGRQSDIQRVISELGWGEEVLELSRSVGG